MRFSRTLCGERLPAFYNGSTFFERTNFYEVVNATDENLETAIRLEAARLGRAILEAEDVEREGRIVESEFEMAESSPQRLVIEGMFAAMFDFHGYARSPIGTVEDFRSLKIEQIRAFYRRAYRPDNAVLFLTGNFAPAKALGLIRRHFGDLKGTGEGRPVTTTREPAARGERRYVIRGQGETAHVLVAYRIPGAASPQAAAAAVLARMLASERTGILHEAVVGKGLASEVDVSSLPLGMPSPYFALASVPKDKDPDAAEAAVIEVMEKNVSGLTQADLDRAKSVLEREFDALFNSPVALGIAMSEYEAAGSWKLLIVRREQTKGVTLDAVKAFAAKYLRRENRVVGRFVPDSSAVAVAPEKEPDIGDYAALLSKVPATVKAVKEFAYTPAALQSALKRFEVGPAKLSLITKEVKGDDVHVHLVIPLARPGIVRPALPSGEALAAIATERTRSLTKEEVRKKLSDAKSHIKVDVSLEAASVSIRTKREALPEVMALATEMLRSPFIDEERLREHVARTEGQLRAQRDEPMRLLPDEIQKMLYPEGDPRRPGTIESGIEELKKLSVDGVMGFHREFLGADGMIGAVIGAVSQEEATRLLSPLVEGWKAAQPCSTTPGAAVEAVTVPAARVATPGKPSAFSVLLQPFRFAPSVADAMALEAAAWCLFGDPLGSRIPRKVREEKALSYATQGVLAIPVRGEQGMVIIFSMTNAKNAEQALGLVRTELDRALEGGITEEELAAFKKSYPGRMATARSFDELLVTQMAELRRAGHDFALWAKQDEEVAGLTLGRVNAALRKYVQPAKAGLIQIGDFR